MKRITPYRKGYRDKHAKKDYFWEVSSSVPGCWIVAGKGNLDPLPIEAVMRSVPLRKSSRRWAHATGSVKHFNFITLNPWDVKRDLEIKAFDKNGFALKSSHFTLAPHQMLKKELKSFYHHPELVMMLTVEADGKICSWEESSLRCMGFEECALPYGRILNPVPFLSSISP